MTPPFAYFQASFSQEALRTVLLSMFEYRCGVCKGRSVLDVTDIRAEQMGRNGLEACVKCNPSCETCIPTKEHDKGTFAATERAASEPQVPMAYVLVHPIPGSLVHVLWPRWVSLALLPEPWLRTPTMHRERDGGRAMRWPVEPMRVNIYRLLGALPQLFQILLMEWRSQHLRCADIKELCVAAAAGRNREAVGNWQQSFAEAQATTQRTTYARAPLFLR